MKNKLNSLPVALLSLFLCVAVPQAHADMHDEPTIVEIAINNPGDFSTLVTAVSKAGLVDTLNGKRQFTVFAPTNEAFDAAATALGYSSGLELVEALDVATLTDILLYHVAPGERFSEDVLEASRVRTMNKSFLFVDPESLTLIGVGTNAGLVAPDIEASNGVIHVIDFVLLPFGV